MGLEDVAKGMNRYNRLDLLILNIITVIQAVTLILTPTVLQVAWALLLPLQQPQNPVVRSETLGYLLVIGDLEADSYALIQFKISSEPFNGTLIF